jgi:hypothetical protein
MIAIRARAAKIGGMDQNPYETPQHYAAKRSSAKAPLIAVVGNGCLLLFGATTAGLGFYFLSVKFALAGLFWLGVGIVGSYYVIASWRAPD